MELKANNEDILTIFITVIVSIHFFFLITVFYFSIFFVKTEILDKWNITWEYFDNGNVKYIYNNNVVIMAIFYLYVKLNMVYQIIQA